MNQIYDYLNKNQVLNWAILEPKITETLEGDKKLLLISKTNGELEGPLENFTYEDILAEKNKNGIAILTILVPDSATNEMSQVYQVKIDQTGNFYFKYTEYEFLKQKDGSYRISAICT